MRTVYKYPLELVDQQSVPLPDGAEIIHTGTDPSGSVCLWAMVNPENPISPVVIHIRGTGHPLPEAFTKYLGSVHERIFVWHVFLA